MGRNFVFECVLVFFCFPRKIRFPNQSIIRMVRVIYNLKALLVLIQTTLKNFQNVPVFRKTGLNF